MNLHKIISNFIPKKEAPVFKTFPTFKNLDFGQFKIDLSSWVEEGVEHAVTTIEAKFDKPLQVKAYVNPAVIIFQETLDDGTLSDLSSENESLESNSDFIWKNAENGVEESVLPLLIREAIQIATVYLVPKVKERHDERYSYLELEEFVTYALQNIASDIRYPINIRLHDLFEPLEECLRMELSELMSEKMSEYQEGLSRSSGSSLAEK